jgi:MoaA/NifB/PqqE/SkfB family radical SAM enzyme
MPRLAWIAHIPYILRHHVLTRAPRPFLASCKLTFRCNLRCQQCPFYTIETPDPTFEQVCATLEALYRRGSRLVVFEGGEPFLWRDGARTLHDVVAEAKKRFFSVGITTNGTLPLDVASDVLWVSLDGLPQTHNRLRGAEVFERILENMRRSKHPRLFAHITVNNQNDGEVIPLIELIKPLVRGVTVQFYYPYHGNDALFLPFERRERLIDELIQAKRAGLPLLNSNAALRALKRNTWRCMDSLLDCADPDGSLRQGCYLRGRSDIDCARCGFSPHTEISLAARGNIEAILAGIRIFL